MELWGEIRRRVLNGEISKRAARAEYDIHWNTLQKILTHSEPPGYRLTKPRPSKLEPFLPIIHEILLNDRSVHRKQRHTGKRIFERLRDEHGYSGGITIVQEAIRDWKAQSREVFLPLRHPPGEAQVDFGIAEVRLVFAETLIARHHSSIFVVCSNNRYLPTMVVLLRTRERNESAVLDGKSNISCSSAASAWCRKTSPIVNVAISLAPNPQFNPSSR